MAKKLLKASKAAVFRQYPFTIILKKAVNNKEIKPCKLKLDPGSKTTGIAILQDDKLIWAAELTHKGQQIKDDLESRRNIRRGRRDRKTRYRQPRFLNRKREKGWLAPSLEHRILTTMTWVKRLIKYCPIDSIAQELVTFDTQKMQNPEISGTEYQQGTLYQYEVREYLLEKFNRTCAYCGAKNTPLEVEHIKPKSKSGSNRVSNLAIAWVPCNQAKSNLDIQEFLADKPSVLKRILAQAKAPLKDEKLEKLHYLDTACVGDTPNLEVLTNQPLLIECAGHGQRQVIHVDKYGFPRKNKAGKLVRKSTETKIVKGFQTGDIVKAVVTKGKKVGSYLGKVAIRKSCSFNIKTVSQTVQGISHKYCKQVHLKDGYVYGF